MVELVQPTPEDIIYRILLLELMDFLVASAEYIKENYAKELLKPQAPIHFQNQMFMEMEFDPTMIRRIGAMNLYFARYRKSSLKDVDSLNLSNVDFFRKNHVDLCKSTF